LLGRRRRRHLHAAFGGDRFQLVAGLGVVRDHLLAEILDRCALALGLRQLAGCDLGHAGLTGLFDKIGIGSRRRRECRSGGGGENGKGDSESEFHSTSPVCGAQRPARLRKQES